MKQDNKLGLLWTFLLERGRVALLLAILAMAWGFSAYKSMPRESSPEVEIPVGIISTVWPGASSVDVEKLVTEKIEREVKTLENVERYTSTSRAGLSIVSVEFEVGTNMDQNMQKLREALDDAERSLPDTLPDDPDLTEASASAIPILTLNISGDFSLSELKRFAETFQDEFEGIQGVKEVLISGLPEEEIHLYIDPISLQKYGLSVEQVAQKINQSHQDLPLGQIFLDGEKLDLRVEGELESISDFFELPIMKKGAQIVTLGEIVEIRREFDTLNVETYSSTGGKLQTSLSLDLIKSEAKTNVAKAVTAALKTIEDYREKQLIPDSLDVNIVYNSADDIQKDLNNLIVTGTQTLVLITIILFFALGWRESLLAFISIPLSMFIAIGMLQLLGETFNFLSLFSLILAVGLLVDNAIIVVEGISENIFYGKKKPIDAAKSALETFRWPIITGTCTTIFAFLPMMFLISGVSGQYVSVIPKTVMVVLISSLVVSLFLVPVFGVAFFTFFPPKPHTEGTLLTKVKEWYEPFMRGILYSSKKLFITLGLSFLTLVFAIGLMVTGQIPVEIFPGGDENFFTAKIELPKGTKLRETRELLPEIEQGLLPLFEEDSKGKGNFKNMVVTVGQVSSYDPEALQGSGISPEEEVIGITFNLKPKKDRIISSEAAADLVEKTLRPLIPSYADLSMGKLEGGPPSGSSAIEIRLVSDDLEHLELVTDDLRAKLESMSLKSGGKLIDITDNRGEVLPQITWKIDRLKLENVGLTISQMSQTLRSAIEGVRVLQISDGEDEIDVVLRLNFSEELKWKGPESLEILSQIPIKTQSGKFIQLSDVAEFQIGPQRSIVRHRDGKRTVTVGANIEGKKVTASQFQAKLEEAIASLDKWPGDSFQIGGDNEEGSRLITEMISAMIFAAFLIGMVLVLQFNSFSQPIIILSAIPLSLTAVLIGFWISQTPISFPTLIGIVALAGIIVNDDIVLIDRINHHRRRTENYEDALIEGCKARMQPIFLTSITTVVGLLPLALSDPVWRGLGFAVIYGMSLSTVLTLLVTPCILLVMRYFQRWIGKKIRILFRKTEN